MHKKMLRHLLFFGVLAFSHHAFGAVPDIRSEFKCEVTYQNIVDTQTNTPNFFEGYTDAHGIGDFLTLSIQLDSDVEKKTGVGFHVSLTDEKRNNIVFSALTSARKTSLDYPKVVTYNFDELGISSKNVLDRKIIYNKSHIYADGGSWSFFGLESGKAKLQLHLVEGKTYRGTLIVEPRPTRDIFMFEFSALNCALVKDSLKDFLRYYSN